MYPTVKAASLFLFTTLISLSALPVRAQKVTDWLNMDAVMLIWHAKTSPYATREEVMDFLQNDYFPVEAEAFPQLYSVQLEGIAGERKGQHCKWWLFESVEARNSYFPQEGGEPTERYYRYAREKDKKISQNRLTELFRGFDTDFNSYYIVVSKSEARERLAELPGLEMDMHYLPLDYGGDLDRVRTALYEQIKDGGYPNSQFFIYYSDRYARKGTYTIMELHLPGHSHRLRVEEADLPLEKELFSSYRIR